MRTIIFIDDKNYSSFFLSKNNTIQSSPPNFEPLNYKLFDKDEIIINKDEKVEGDYKVDVIHSPVRQHKSIAGVLVLENKKTFGRVGKKMLYQCYPDDKHLPVFLIPYQEKIKFNKNPINIYVTFEFTSWDDKHPIGRLTNSLGLVDSLSCFYEYQLYSKSLNASIQKFTRDAATALKQKTEKEYIDNILQKYPNIVNKINSETKIFAIDPKHSKDYDDAFGVEKISTTEYKIYIYISNVTVWIEMLNLWSSFSKRVSTIYLPDKRRPMLPTCLSECLCSLVNGEIRFAFTCEIHVKDDTIINKKFYNSAIKVYKNFCYDDADLDGFLPYQQLFDICIRLKEKYKDITYIRGSHDIVNYMMILMNHFCGNEMINHKNGVYRSFVSDDSLEIPSELSSEAKTFLQGWNGNGGQYVVFSENIHHDIMKLNNYIHITSPIRRLVDLLNMIQIQKNMGLIDFGTSANTFLNTWLEKLDYINKTSRAVRKIQSDCSLLELVTNNEALCEKTHKGVVFDKIKRNDGYFQYGVYLYDTKIVSRVKMVDSVENYTEHLFNIYVFKKESSFKKKIKLVLAEQALAEQVLTK